MLQPQEKATQRWDRACGRDLLGGGEPWALSGFSVCRDLPRTNPLNKVAGLVERCRSGATICLPSSPD